MFCKAESYPIIVLDDAVLEIYDDDFLPETDPSGPLPITKLWSHIQKLKSEEILLLKEFAVRKKTKMRFPTMWHFDKCRRACAASF